MKDTNVTKIRQLLKKARKWIAAEGGVICPHKFELCNHDNENCPIFCLDEALALLPCPTCNDTGFVQAECEACAIGVSHSASECGGGKPCPDCQKKLPKLFKCKHYKEYSQSVPVPFGVGTCSEPLGDCTIESISEDCTIECIDYAE